jgi:hypothetical protein
LNQTLASAATRAAGLGGGNAAACSAQPDATTPATPAEATATLTSARRTSETVRLDHELNLNATYHRPR